jgi:tape measure domain-containing protein
MSDFSFEVVADASKANRAIGDVEANLAKISASAAAVALKMRDALGGGSNAAASGQVAARKAAGELADQLKRQETILKAINGPLDSYKADMQALDSLLRQNKVSAAEFTEQVKRLGDEFRRSSAAQSGANTGGGPMSALKKGAAIAGVSIGVGQIGGMANEFQELQNRLRYLAGGDVSKVNALFAETQRVAQATRSDISSTTEAFVRLSLATKDMGLSQSETMQLTERINKAIKLSGATSAEASAGMIQLSQGLASGALRGDELRSVMESLPAVADVIAKSMGVTRGELRTLGSEGKITADVVVEAFRKAGPELDKSFGNTVPTMSDHLTQFKNEMIVTSGSLVKSTGAAEAFGAALHIVGTITKTVAGFFSLMEHAFGDASTKIAVGAAAMGLAIKAGLGPLSAAIGLFEAAAYAGQKLGEWLNKDLIAITKWNNQIIVVHQAYSQEMQAVIKEADAIHQSYLAHRSLTDQLQLTARALVNGSANLSTLGDLAEVAAAKLGQMFGQLDAGEQALAKLNEPWAEAQKDVETYSAALAILQGRIDDLKNAGAKNPINLLSAGDVQAIRALRDAELKKSALSTRYGQIVVDLTLKDRTRERAIADLKGALAAGEITQKQYNEAMKQYLPHADKSHKKQLDIVKVIRDEVAAREAALKLLREYDAFQAQNDDAVYNLGDRAVETLYVKKFQLTEAFKRAEEDLAKTQEDSDRRRLEFFRSIETPLDKYKAGLAEIDELFRDSGVSAEIIARIQRQLWESTVGADWKAREEKRIEALTESWNKRLEEIQESNRALGESFRPIGDAIRDAFMQGELAAERLDQALRQVAFNLFKFMALQAAASLSGSGAGFAGAILGGIFGGSPGFAHGGVIMEGSGGTDSQLVAFRKSPNERVTIETPEQYLGHSARGGGRSGVSVNVLARSSEREITSAFMGSDGEQVIAQIDRRWRRRRR